MGENPKQNHLNSKAIPSIFPWSLNESTEEETSSKHAKEFDGSDDHDPNLATETLEIKMETEEVMIKSEPLSDDDSQPGGDYLPNKNTSVAVEGHPITDRNSVGVQVQIEALDKEGGSKIKMIEDLVKVITDQRKLIRQLEDENLRLTKECKRKRPR